MCFSTAHDERFGGSVCAGRVDGSPLPLPDRSTPLQHADSRLPAFIFGRVPPGVGHVDVEVSGDRSPERHPVFVGEGGEGDGSYAVELPRGSTPRAVVGLRSDGTTVRYEVPRGHGPNPIVPSGRGPATVNAAAAITFGLLLTAGAVWAVRRSLRRRLGRPPPR